MGDGWRIDLHVHSGRYSQCAECVDPYGLATAAAEVGVDALVLAEHDVFWQDEEIELLRASSNSVWIYRGIEISAEGCHLLAIGIDDAALLVPRSSPEEVVRVVHELGGVVILAHPYRDADPAGLPVELFDAIEVGSTSFSESEAARAVNLARCYRKPAVAASDAHALSKVGWAWTEFEEPPADEKALADAIRLGFGRPVMPHPFPG